MEAMIKLKIIWNVTTTEYLNTITLKWFNLKAISVNFSGFLNFDFCCITWISCYIVASDIDLIWATLIL